MIGNRIPGAGARWVVVGLALTVGAGCAGRSVPIGHDALSSIKAAGPVKVARHQPPSFKVEDPGNSKVESLAGVSGGELVIPGRKPSTMPMEDEYALEDPAIAVRAKLLEALSYELGVTPDGSDIPPLTDDSLDVLVNTVGADGWLLEVSTIRWGLAYDPALWTRYRVQVEARGRLIDLGARRVAWQATCDGSERDVPKKSKSKFEDLTREDATALKERLTAAADRCADELVNDMFHGVR